MTIPPLELKRQLFHLAFGLGLAALLSYGLVTPAILLGLAILGIALSVLARARRIPVVHWFLEHCERSEDRETFPGRGVIHYLLGCLLALAFFDKDIAIAGILVLALGDSVSHLVGRLYGRTPHPLNRKKLVEGWLAGIVAGAVGAATVVHPVEAIAASAVAMTLETVEWGTGKRVLDDNLFIPAVAALVIAAIRL
jgi:dolichol kinase